MTGPVSTYRATVAGGLRVAAGPLALVAANVATLAARGYRVWVRDPDGRVVSVRADDGRFTLTYHPGPAPQPTPRPGRTDSRPSWPSSAAQPPNKRGATPHDNNHHHRDDRAAAGRGDRLRPGEPQGGARARFVANVRLHGACSRCSSGPTPTDAGVYELVAGERRLRAARTVGLETVPSIVRTLTDQEVLEHQAIENIQRQDLRPTRSLWP